MRISDWSSDVCSSDLAKLQEIGRLLHPADRLRQRRAEHWREMALHQEMRLHTRPCSPAGADRHVTLGARKIDDLLRCLQPHCDARVFQLERADVMRQPMRGDRKSVV